MYRGCRGVRLHGTLATIAADGALAYELRSIRIDIDISRTIGLGGGGAARAAAARGPGAAGRRLPPLIRHALAAAGGPE